MSPFNQSPHNFSKCQPRAAAAATLFSTSLEKNFDFILNLSRRSFGLSTTMAAFPVSLGKDINFGECAVTEHLGLAGERFQGEVRVVDLTRRSYGPSAAAASVVDLLSASLGKDISFGECPLTEHLGLGGERFQGEVRVVDLTRRSYKPSAAAASFVDLLSASLGKDISFGECPLTEHQGLAGERFQGEARVVYLTRRSYGPSAASAVDLLSASLGKDISFGECPLTEHLGLVGERFLGKLGIVDLTRRSCALTVERCEGEEGILDPRALSLSCGLSAAATVIRKRRIPGLTYEFDEEFPDEAKPALLRAFASWEEPLNFTFSFSTGGDGEADIVIGMYSGDHSDPHPFKAGPGGELAHASFPPHGEMHFNSDQPWCYDLVPPPAGSKLFFDFQSVAVHEIGHLLGLEHIDNRKAVMYEFIDPGEIRRGLTDADVAALEFIYSDDPNFC